MLSAGYIYYSCYPFLGGMYYAKCQGALHTVVITKILEKSLTEIIIPLLTILLFTMPIYFLFFNILFFCFWESLISIQPHLSWYPSFLKPFMFPFYLVSFWRSPIQSVWGFWDGGIPIYQLFFNCKNSITMNPVPFFSDFFCCSIIVICQI